MKKLLSIIWAISLIGTSTTSLVACNTPQEYTKEELAKLKEENKINTTNQEIKDNLEWIESQEKPFNDVDNKYYYVVWRGDKNDSWKIANFQNNEKIIPTKEKQNIFKDIDEKNENKLKLNYHGNLYAGKITSIDVDLNIYAAINITYWPWRIDRGIYFKSVYRWNLYTQEPNLDIDKDGSVIVKN